MTSADERIHACAKCGVMRSKNEGGEIFTVCDECWHEKPLILDTCRIFRDIDKHPLPDHNCKIDLKLSCGSMMIGCDYEVLLEYWRASRDMYYVGAASVETERRYEARYEKATSAVYAMLSAAPKPEDK
jgi:hypothetical protein